MYIFSNNIILIIMCMKLPNIRYINSTILNSFIDNLVIVEQTSNKLGGKIVDIAIHTIILILLYILLILLFNSF